ncbi:MAG TPA: phosphoglycerate kinase [Rhodospirillales bacterium]|nr:phosphoglycerate kinase [Rhodospirillales bacterium]
MSQFKTIDDLDVAGMRVLVRLDLNVPMADGKITDTTRIDRSVRTLTELSNRGALVIVISHFGRPKGQVVPELSLAPVAKALSQASGHPVGFASDTVGARARMFISEMGEGEIVMLENLRFNRGEEENDRAFTLELSKLGDLYVNDAFSCSHRAHSSIEGLAHLLPSAAGRLMQAELESLSKALENPEKPVAAVVGGAKVSTKMEVLGNLASKVQMLIIGGGMANTLLYAQGYDVGNSLCEKDMADEARGILERAEQAGCQVVLPMDGVVAREFKAGADSDVVSLDAIPADSMMLDIGPASIADVSARLETCKTLVWNGPFGAFEIPPFDKGTNAVAQAAANLTTAGKLISVAGGGDTVAALAHAGVSDDFTYISTAGGAFLEWMEGKKLPGVEVLRK